MGVWNLASALATLVFVTYAWSSLFVSMMRDFAPNKNRDVWITIRLELKPFALPAIAVLWLDGVIGHGGGWLNNLWTVLNLISWWYWRKDRDDDDRWKKRGKKLAEQVSVIGGRLQVVPARSS